MSLILFDFQCSECSHLHEALIDSKERHTECPECGAISKRQISTPRVALDGTDPSFPGAYMKWARKHEQATKVANKKLTDHGDETY